METSFNVMKYNTPLYKCNRRYDVDNLVPCTIREIREVYGTDNMVELLGILKNKCHQSSSIQEDITEHDHIYENEKNQVLMEAAQCVLDPSAFWTKVNYHARLEHSLHQLGKSLIAMGNNEMNQCGYDINEWLEYITDKMDSVNIEDPEFADRELFKIYTTPGIEGDINFCTAGFTFSYIAYTCGCICMCGMWSDYYTKLFKSAWNKQLHTLSPSMFSTLFLTADRKSLHAWGLNTMGQCSTGALGDAFIYPKVIPSHLFHNEVIRLVKNGPESSYLVTESNKLFVCGNNLYHQLGLPWTTDATENDDVGVDSDMTEKLFRRIEERKIIPELTFVEYFPYSEETIVQISVGEKHVFILTRKGNMYIAGSNACGQLGDPSIIPSQKYFRRHHFNEPVTAIHCFANSTFWITAKGNVFVCGDNTNAELGIRSETLLTIPTYHPILSQQGIEQIVGNNNLFALSKNGKIFCWGSNEENELGVPEYDSERVDTPVRHFALERMGNIVAHRGYKLCVSPGFDHTFVYFKKNSKHVTYLLENLDKACREGTASRFEDVSFIFPKDNSLSFPNATSLDNMDEDKSATKRKEPPTNSTFDYPLTHDQKRLKQ